MQRPDPPNSSARPERVWAAVAAATTINLPLGSVYAFSVLLRPLEELLGASRSELAFVFSLATICFTLGLNLGPRLFGRMPAPLLVALSAGICTAGIALASRATDVWQLALGYGVLFGIGGGICFIVMQQGCNMLVRRRQGLLNGYIVSLWPAGAMLAAPLFGWGIAAWGVRGMLGGFALVVAALGLVTVALTFHSGMRLAAPVVGTGVAAAESAGLRAVFWRLFTVFFLAAAAGLTVLSQAAGIVAAYGGATTTALLATTGITGAIAAARLGGGGLVDRFAPARVLAGAHLLALAGAVALTLRPTAAVAIAGLGMIGMGYGFVSGATAGAIGTYWPKPDFGRIAGRLYIAWCLAAVSLPMLAARLFDLTGGYGTALIVAGAGNLLGALVAFSLPRPAAAEIRAI